MSNKDDSTTSKTTNDGDPKKWPLGRYYWATVAYAMKNDLPAPRLELYFDGMRALMLRVDEDNPTQFLLSNYLESELFLHAKTGEPIDLDSVPEEQWPKSRWESLSFSLLIEDEEEECGNIFAAEIKGNADGIGEAIDIAIKVFNDELERLNSLRPDGSQASLDAVVTRWDTREKMHESDRRYSNITENGVQSMHERGKPHDSTIVYSTCGRNVLLMLRTMERKYRLRLVEGQN